MKKSTWKIWFWTGFLIVFFAPVFCMFFPLSRQYETALGYFLMSVGVVIIILSVAKKRLEKSTDENATLFKILTPAQICLTVSCAFFAGGIFFTEMNEEGFLGGLFLMLWVFLVWIAIVLAIVRIVRNHRLRKEEAAKRRARSSSLSSTMATAQRVCERCGIRVEEDAVSLHDHLFCAECAEIMKQAEQSEFAQPETACALCGENYRKSEMYFVDDQYYCRKCFKKQYAGTEIPGD